MTAKYARTAAALALFGGSILLSYALTQEPSPLAASDHWFESIIYRFVAPAQPTSDQIIIVAITEDTLSNLPFRSPIDRFFLAELVDTLTARGARVIGLDLLFDRLIDPTDDTQLRTAFKHAPVVLASASPLLPQQQHDLDTFLKGHPSGEVNLVANHYDDTIRTYAPFINRKLSFAAAVAQAAGVKPPADTFRIFWRRNLAGRPFAIYPAHLIKALPLDWLRGKIILVGTMLPGEDEHRTPFTIFSTPMFGVEIHAHALSQMLENPRQPPPRGSEFVAIAVATFAGMGLAATTAGMIFSGGLIALALTIVGTVLLTATAFGGALLLPMAPLIALGLSAGGTRFWVGRTERNERRVLQQLFSRFVGEPVVQELWKDRDSYMKGGRPKPVSLTATVLFSDIANFTSYTERLPAEPLYGWLNEYIDAMVEIVNANQGIVLRFIGDGILAVFGVPIARHTEAEIDRDARNAVACARAMRAAVETLNSDWEKRDLPHATIRVGIYTGPMLAGSVGSGSHMEYTLQGDTVNTAARLEMLGKDYQTHDESIILIGEPTYARLDDDSPIKLASVRLRGKQSVTTIYRVL